MAKKTELSYSEAIAELESIVAKLQNNEYAIDELQKCTARSLELLKFCKAKLFETDEALLVMQYAEMVLFVRHDAALRRLQPLFVLWKAGGVERHSGLESRVVNGAQALGLDGGIGSIEAGKRPGLVLIENLSYDSAGAHLTAESRSRRLV